jgi:hypothetical protein
MQIDHRAFIHFQAVQKPMPRPSSMSGALQKMPVSRRASSQRPRNRPGKGRRDEDPAQHPDLRKTTADGQVSLAQPLSRRSRRRRVVADQRVVVRLGWRTGGHRNSTRVCAGPQPADHAPYGVKLQANGLDMFGPFLVSIRLEPGQHSASSVARLSPATASRVAMAIGSVPVDHVMTPPRTAQKPFGFGRSPTRRSRSRAPSEMARDRADAEAAAGILGAQASMSSSTTTDSGVTILNLMPPPRCRLPVGLRLRGRSPPPPCCARPPACRPCRASFPTSSSASPSSMARQPESVSASGTLAPGVPVKASVTMKGWVRNRCNRRARLTISRSAAPSSSTPSKRDDVGQFAKPRQRLPDSLGGLVVLLPDDQRIEQHRGRGQRVDGGIEPFGRLRAATA